ncbi:MAG: HAMP domain-containing sensor histidine kinase [Chloroflexota bacterium]
MRAVGRVRASVLAKLLVAFVGTVVLLVILGVLGLRVIGDSNDRVVTLGDLQQRATAYRHLQTGVAGVQQVMLLRAGTFEDAPEVRTFAALFSAEGRLVTDGLIGSLLGAQSSATDPNRLGFEPPAEDQGTLAQIAQDYQGLSEVMARITQIDQAGGEASASLQLVKDVAQPLATRLKKLADTLVAKVLGATDTLISENDRAFADSQRLFVAVAAVSVVLALLLGYILSWSLVGPIRRMQTRLAAIASGDFSGHVEVSNRDELGALAANLNQMNDELGRLYNELEAASRHKSEFLANMSHELRTPLNAIIGFSQVLKQQMYGALNAKQADYVDDVLSSGQHLLNLINDILDLAKVEAGRMELQPTTFALPGILENAMLMVRERAIRQGVGLSAAIDPSVGLLEADERKIKQILFNLLSNAVKFTPGGGQVTLAATVVEDQVEISVRDSGIGINAEDQVRIFEEFYQVGTAQTHEGTGLGLALTRRLVELHHGRLSVESEPGVGSTFTVALPLRQPDVAGVMAPATPAEPASS